MIDPRAIFKVRTDWEPYPYQYNEQRPEGTAWEAIYDGRNTIIAVGTGGGKTEAALVPALETGKRIIILFPAKSLLQDQKLRIIEELTPDKEVVIDTGDEDERTFYTADIILTSLDKFLYRMFAYGRRRWAYLYPYRIALNPDRETILILDEAHTYEDVIFSHFWFVLHKLTYEHRVQTIILSATLPERLVEALVDKEREFFPRPATEEDFFTVVTDSELRSGKVFFGGIRTFPSGIKQAWDAYLEGERVILVVNRVTPPREKEKWEGSTLQEIWTQVMEWAQELGLANEIAHIENGEIHGSVLTYHGHQMPGYRKPVLERLKTLDDKDNPKPYLLLTTSAMEVGVDISATVMFTQLCEPDAFVQRIGRCARRKGEKGEVVVLQREGGRVPKGTAELRDYLVNLPIGKELDTSRKKDINQMNKPPRLRGIEQRLEYLQDMAMYRYVYDYVRENHELWRQGIIVTRQWEPSVTLVRSEERNGQTYIGGIPSAQFWFGKDTREHYSIPVSGAADIAPYCAWVFEGYDEDNDQPVRVSAGGKQGRPLGEALRIAGYSNIKANAKEATRYGIGLPLVLVMPSDIEIRALFMTDDNAGLTYRSRYASLKGWSPSPLLRRREVELRKDKGSIKLRLWWLEPKPQDEDEE